MSALAAGPVMDPIPFPPATLNRARTQRQLVQCPDGSSVQSIVVSSSSGAFYEKGPRLKEAIYGEVCSGHLLELSGGQLRRTGERIAMKIIFRERFNLLRSQNCPEDPMNEIACLSFIRDTPTPTHPTPPNRYPNLCYFHEACENEHFLFSMMEFIDGSELYDYLEDNGTLTPGEARIVMSQIVTGWSLLHGLGISHRDMSLENVMLIGGSAFRAVIIDFGMARRAHLLADGSHAKFPPLGQAGKAQYMAPEVLLNSDPFRGCDVDVWALSVMLFMLVAGHPPLTTALDVDDLFRRIVNNESGGLPGLIRAWRHPFSAECTHLMTAMMQRNGNDRLTHDQIIAHNWWAAGAP